MTTTDWTKRDNPDTTEFKTNATLEDSITDTFNKSTGSYDDSEIYYEGYDNSQGLDDSVDTDYTKISKNVTDWSK